MMNYLLRTYIFSFFTLHNYVEQKKKKKTKFAHVYNSSRTRGKMTSGIDERGGDMNPRTERKEKKKNY